MQRVHVVEEPLTDYLRYEMKWSYESNAAAGEDVRILPVQPGEWPGALPRVDYWLFDSQNLWIMNYDDAGRFLYAELVTDPARIVASCYWRDTALHQAMPYGEYLAQAGLR